MSEVALALDFVGVISSNAYGGVDLTGERYRRANSPVLLTRGGQVQLTGWTGAFVEEADGGVNAEGAVDFHGQYGVPGLEHEY